MSDPSIDILTARISEAKIDPQTRDALAADLDYAAEIKNDAPPAMQGVKRLLISGVRRELLACGRESAMRAEFAAAIQACRASASDTLACGGRVGRARVMLAALQPWRWPIAVVCFSPFAGDLFGRVVALFRAAA